MEKNRRKIFYVSLFSLLLCVTLIPTHKTSAFGIFQLVTPSSGVTVVVNQQVNLTIQFIYSGDYIPHVSLLGSTLPTGIKLQSIINEGDGLYSIDYYGTPTVAGDYPLMIKLTDNNGALLTQSFDFNVVKADTIQVISDSMPNGYLNKPYSADVYIHYIGGLMPQVGISNLPDGINFSLNNLVSTTTLIYQGTTTVSFFGTPTKAGQYSIKLGIQENDNAGNMNSKSQAFTINIIDPNANNINQANFNNATSTNNSVATTSSQISATCDNGYLFYNGECLTPLENCVRIYGGNVTVAKDSKNNNCSCSSDYIWNGGKTGCIKNVVKYAIPKNNTNIHVLASCPSKIIGSAKKNTKYEIIDSSNKSWVKVKFNNKTGWILKTFITIK